ncbi:MAG TPA: DUF3883 domain-containing protein [Thermoflexia bacterium]|jgi:hypothetical protein|nr:DUF3883 domain-containing protein [Thermoflexia bacterium]
MFVEEVTELIESVLSFMESPEYWREAVGSHPKYFVHYQEGEESFFGLSKFCAFKDITLKDYVTVHRYEANGTTTQKHISRVTGQSWVPLKHVDESIRNAFEKWFFSFFPKSYDLDQIFIISISAVKPSRGERSRPSQLAPGELEKRLARQNKIGKAGELIAYRYEVERLAALGVGEPEKWIDHVSERNAAAGFDIWSHPPRRGVRYIEVKSSTEDPSSFYITRNEIETLRKHGDEAYLYVVLVTDVGKGQGKVVQEVQNPIAKLESRGTLEAVLYRADLKGE